MQNAERRMKRGRWRRRLSLCVLHFAFCVGFIGCAKGPTTQPTTRPSTLQQRQDKALHDPFGYSPDTEQTDISGGGLTDFDRDGFNRDLKNALDP